MREIEFRVWDKIIPKTLKEAEENEPTGEMVNWDYVKKSDYLIDGLNGKFPIMQFTGLKDKNGKKIFEGDIIRIYSFAFINGFMDGEVFYHDRFAEFGVKATNSLGYWFLHHYKVEVIGNIFENPNWNEE